MPRSVQTVQGLKYLQQLIKRSKYKSRPFEEALQSVFRDSALFAPRKDSVKPSLESNNTEFPGQHPETMQPLRVAVTAVSESGRRPYLLANYNVGTYHASSSSSSASADKYWRARATDDASELHTWEA